MNRFFTTSALCFILVGLQSQVVLVPPVVSEFHITPQAITRALIVSPFSGSFVSLQAEIIQLPGNIPVLTASTAQFEIKKGTTDIQSLGVSVRATYGGSPAGQYVKTHHRLPVGQFRLCVTILPGGGVEAPVSECQELTSESGMMLSLVSPSDGETIDSPLPILSWIHSESFSSLSPGQSFRLSLVEMKERQGAEEALRSNPVVFTANDLKSHVVMYPVSGTPLIPGHKYAWMVELLDQHRSVITSEFWWFTINKEVPAEELKYVRLRRNGAPQKYRVIDERVYFSFDQNYSSSRLPVVVITDSGGRTIQPEIKEDEEEIIVETTHSGYGQFILDTRPYNLKKGFYTMKVNNAKGDRYQLLLEIE